MSTSVDLGYPTFRRVPHILCGALDSLWIGCWPSEFVNPKDGSNTGICQSINQAAYEWALKHASPVATRR